MQQDRHTENARSSWSKHDLTYYGYVVTLLIYLIHVFDLYYLLIDRNCLMIGLRLSPLSLFILFVAFLFSLSIGFTYCVSLFKCNRQNITF